MGFRLTSPLINRVPLPDCSASIYCPLQFGAVGDGTTDDTSSLNATITKAGNAGGGVVVIPEMQFLLSGVLMTMPNVIIVGQGAGSIFLGATDEVSLMIAISAANCEIHGVQFKGQMLTQPGSPNQDSNEAIHLLSGAVNTIVNQCRFGGIELAHAFNVCIRGHQGARQPHITGNFFDRIIGTDPGYGYHVQLADVQGGLVVHNSMMQAETQGRHHVYLSASTSGVMVAQNEMQGGVEPMITVFSSATEADGNKIIDNDMDGLGGGAGTAGGMIEVVGDSNSCKVSGNSVRNSGAYGLKFEGDGVADNCHDHAAIDNHIEGAALGGIYGKGSERLLIAVNTIKDCTSRAIQLATTASSTCDGATVVGNVVTGTLHKYALDLDTAGDNILVASNNFQIGYTDFYNGVTANHVFAANLPSDGSTGPLDKFDATNNPGPGNDDTEGYSVGSHWINVTGETGFICVDSTTADAVWVETTAGAGGGAPDQDLFATITGDTGSFTADGVTNVLEVLGGTGASTVVTDAAGTTTVTVNVDPVFVDNTFRIKDNAVDTKVIAFQADGIVAGNTRSIIMPDHNAILGNIKTNKVHVDGDGSDHADVGSNTSHRAIVSGNPHVVTDVEVLPAMGAHGGKFLKTNGGSSLWEALPVDPTEFADNVFRIQDNTTPSKELAFEVGAISAVTTRTITVGDSDIVLPKSNLGASDAPDANDDNTQGYETSSRWVDTTGMKEYVCIRATTGNATWKETTISGGGGSQNLFSAIDGDTGGPFSADGLTNTLEILGTGFVSTNVTDIAGKTTVTINDSHNIVDHDTTATGAELTELTDASETALHTHIPTPYQGLGTGLLTGGEVTLNADPTKFDVAAGTGVIIDWTVPATPVRTEVSWSGLTAQTVPNLATAPFTTLGMNSSGVLVKANTPGTPNERRTIIQLQDLTHVSGTVIDFITSNSQPAYDVGQSLLDYSLAIGPVNSGNNYSSNGVNLLVDKVAGTTTQPFINRSNDLMNPSVKSNGADTNVNPFEIVYQDGIGGFTFVNGQTAITPDQWDDGSGVLATVANNKFTIKRMYFFGQTGQTIVTYGQAEYSTLAAAEAAVFTEEPALSPLLGFGTFTTALICKKGTTDLSDTANNTFINITALGFTTGTTVAGNQNLWETIASDSGSVVASIATDTLTVTGGDNINTSAAADVLTIAVDPEFSDLVFRINDNAAPTKQLGFEASAITAGQLRLLFMPDDNVLLGDIATNRIHVDIANGNPHGVDEVDILPAQATHSAKFLTTNGTVTSWAAPSGSGDMTKAVYDAASINEQLVGLTTAQTLTSKTLTAPIVNSPTGIVKGDVGLGNVDNTTDLNKPISTLTQTEINTKEDTLAAFDTTPTDASANIVTSNGVFDAIAASDQNVINKIGDGLSADKTVQGLTDTLDITGGNNITTLVSQVSDVITLRVALDSDLVVKGVATNDAKQVATGTSAMTLDLTLSNKGEITPTEAMTLTVNFPASGVGSFTIIVKNASDFAITWPSAFKWPGGTAPTQLNTMMVGVYYDGTDAWASVAEDMS